MRAGVEPESLLRFLKDGDLPLQLHVAPETGLCYEFPYLPSMPSYLLSSDNVYLKSQIYGAATIRGPSTYPPAPPVNRQNPGGESAVYFKPYHLARIADDRLESIRVSTWTSVISDNQLFANLLNAYFMYAYQAFPAFNKDLFLDDMVTGQTQFCSRLLVNAVLAHACVSS